MPHQSVRCSDIRLRTISQGIPQPSINKISLKIIYINLNSTLLVNRFMWAFFLEGSQDVCLGAILPKVSWWTPQLGTGSAPETSLSEWWYQRYLELLHFPGTWSIYIIVLGRFMWFIYQYHWYCSTLTHWGRGEMAAILQTTFSNAFLWMKMFKFRLKFHWSLFPRVQMTIFQQWFR